MTTMSLTAYAATHNASRQAASKWRERGLLVMAGEEVDVAASDAKMKGAGKGRFRVKAHGGRRQPSVHGVQDRPGLDSNASRSVSPAPVPWPKPEPWRGWAWAGNFNNPLSKIAREFIAAADPNMEEEIAHLIDYSEWENACTHLGWDRWPAAVAATIAADLGIPAQAAQVRNVLHKHVRTRLLSLDLEIIDLEDSRLKPR